MVIYKTVNLINGKFYIGKDKNNNNWYLGSGKILNYAIKKYGKENFKKEVLEYCLDINHLKEREIYWIEYYNATNKEIGYNIQKGGDGGYNYGHLTAEQLVEVKKKISIGIKLSIKEGRKKVVGRSSESARLWSKKMHSTRTQEEYKIIAKKGNETKKEKGTHPSFPESKQKNSEGVKKFWAKHPEVKLATAKKISEKLKNKSKLQLCIEKYGETIGPLKYNEWITKISKSKKGKSAWNKGLKTKK